MVKSKKYVLVKHFKGEPKVTDLKLMEEELPPLQDGEFLAEAEYLSVDPYMRPYMDNKPLGSTMIGNQIAKIVESKNSKFPVGSTVVGSFGWRNRTIVDPKGWVKDPFQVLYILPDIGDLPSSLGLGMLGMPG